VQAGGASRKDRSDTELKSKAQPQRPRHAQLDRDQVPQASTREWDGDDGEDDSDDEEHRCDGYRFLRHAS
jgi:hypothetical protein